MRSVVFFCLCFSVQWQFFQVVCQTISDSQQRFLFNCWQHRNDLHWIDNAVRRSQAESCRTYLNEDRGSGQSKNLSTSSDFEQSGSGTIFSYVSALTMWRNDEGSLHRLLLNSVSSCHVLSHKVEKTWRKFFTKRLRTFSVVPMIYERSWHDTTGTITLRPSQARYKSTELVGAELVLRRQKPFDIGEAFGSYRTDAAVKVGRSKLVSVHSGRQSSCSLRDGRFVVLDLQIDRLAHWHRRKKSNLTMSVAVRPIQQYFFPQVDEMANVVEEVVGLVLHFRRSGRASRRPSSRNHLLSVLRPSSSDFERRTPEQSLHPRLRRSAAVAPSRSQRQGRGRHDRRRVVATISVPRVPETNRPCEIVPFHVSRRTTERFSVYRSENSNLDWNIQECAGLCSTPIPNHVNVTNHGLMLNSEVTGRLCCVPIKFRALYYITQVDGELHTPSLNNLIATDCGCR